MAYRSDSVEVLEKVVWDTHACWANQDRPTIASASILNRIVGNPLDLLRAGRPCISSSASPNWSPESEPLAAAARRAEPISTSTATPRTTLRVLAVILVEMVAPAFGARPLRLLRGFRRTGESGAAACRSDWTVQVPGRGTAGAWLEARAQVAGRLGALFKVDGAVTADGAIVATGSVAWPASHDPASPRSAASLVRRFVYQCRDRGRHSRS